MNEQNQKSTTENNKNHNGRRLVAGLLLAGVATGGIGVANHKVESTPANTSSRSIPVTANMPSYREVNQITLEPTHEETIQEAINTTDTNNSVVLEVQEGSSQKVSEQTPNN